jgi:radical SAM superfamily enzyme YgiQ (UPF0313 family)
MPKKLKNLFIGLGPGYHHQVRIMHSMIKEKCDSSMLFFHIEKNVDSIGDDLRFHYSMGYKDFPKTFEVFRNYIKKNQFDLIGLGFMSHHWDIYVELSKVIRETLPNCKIIAGGVHAWHISQTDTLNHCDYICAAEGEELYSQLIDHLSSKPEVSPINIPGLIEKHEGKVIHPPVKPYMPMDQVPFPTYGDRNTYSITSINEDKPIFLNEDAMVDGHWAFVHIGRGCVFRCTFCINAIHKDPTVRLRSVDRVIAEMKDMLSVCKNIKTIFFEDEIFPVKGNFLKEFCEKYKKEINLPFWVCLYPHMLSEEKLKMLKSAGLIEITMGLQSGSQRIRNEIYDRKDKNEMIVKENALLSKHNVMTYYDLIIRNPWETEEDLGEALDLINKLKRPYYLKIYTLAYYPKHPITLRALKEKMVDPIEVDATIGYLAVTTPHKVSAEENYWEDSFVIWHNKLRKRMLNGENDEKYFLLMAYHGFWFIPKSILDFLYMRFKKKSKWELYVFSYLLEKLLVFRGFTITQYSLIVMTRLKQRGLIYVIKKIFEKAKSKLSRSIVTTASGSAQIMEEVLYKRK